MSEEFIPKKRKRPSYRREHGSKYRRILVEHLAERDGWFCQMCGDDFEVKQPTVDHIVRLADDGDTGIWNMQLLCRPCHYDKDDNHPGAISRREQIRLRWEKGRIKREGRPRPVGPPGGRWTYERVGECWRLTEASPLERDL